MLDSLNNKTADEKNALRSFDNNNSGIKKSIGNRMSTAGLAQNISNEIAILLNDVELYSTLKLVV